MPRAIKTPHECRSQIVGTLRRTCPYCGHVQTHHITPTTWKLRCKNGQCTREVGYGQVFYQLDNPRKARRMTPPDLAFPAREVREYQNGDPVHVLA